jgi:hypothetical protein
MVNPSDVTVQIALLLLAFGFKSTIESTLRDMLTNTRVTIWLAGTTALFSEWK